MKFVVIKILTKPIEYRVVSSDSEAKRLSEALQSTGRKTVLLPSELPKAKKDVLQVLQDVLNKGSDSLPVPQNSAMAVELPTQ
jgi:ATP-dependent Clp protease ATP-binding subunit ClpA